MQHGQAFQQRTGVPDGMPAPAGQLLPLPSSRQGAQHGAAAGAPLYAQSLSHQAAPSQLQLPQHSIGVAVLQATSPAHVHSVMLSTQTDPAAPQPAPAMQQNHAAIMLPATAAASNAVAGAGAVSVDQAHFQPSALHASQQPPAGYAESQAAGARTAQHHARQRQHSSSGVQLQQQCDAGASVAHRQPYLACGGTGVNNLQACSSSIAAEPDNTALQHPFPPPAAGPSDRLQHDSQQAKDHPR